jgi:hypothetical protein
VKIRINSGDKKSQWGTVYTKPETETKTETETETETQTKKEQKKTNTSRFH